MGMRSPCVPSRNQPRLAAPLGCEESEHRLSAVGLAYTKNGTRNGQGKTFPQLAVTHDLVLANNIQVVSAAIGIPCVISQTWNCHKSFLAAPSEIERQFQWRFFGADHLRLSCQDRCEQDNPHPDMTGKVNVSHKCPPRTFPSRWR